jgi:hypothetical protein
MRTSGVPDFSPSYERCKSETSDLQVKIMLKQKVERDDDSIFLHRALVSALRSSK